MKSKAGLFWFAVSLALAAVLGWQWNKTRKLQGKVEQLQVQVEKGGSGDVALKAKVKELETERTKLTGELRATEFELNNTRMAYSAAAQMTNGPQGRQMQAAMRGQGRQQPAEGAGGM